MPECAQGAARKGTADVARAFEEKVMADAEKAKSFRAFLANNFREAALLALDLVDLWGVQVDAFDEDPAKRLVGKVSLVAGYDLELRVADRVWHSARHLKGGLWELNGEEDRDYTRDEVVDFMCREVLKGMRPAEE